MVVVEVAVILLKVFSFNIVLVCDISRAKRHWLVNRSVRVSGGKQSEFRH